MIQITKKIILNNKVDLIWNIITNNNHFDWRSDLSNIEIVDKDNFIEYTKNKFPTYFKITKKIKNKLYEFDLYNKNIKGHWIGKFNEIGYNKTELELTEQIETSNFLMNLIGKLYLKKQQKLYIKNLNNALKK